MTTSKWLFHSNNVHLNYFATKTVMERGGQGGGAAPGKVPISFSIEPEVSFFITRDRGELSLTAFPSPGFPAQRSKHPESPWKRASPSPAEDSRL